MGEPLFITGKAKSIGWHGKMRLDAGGHAHIALMQWGIFKGLEKNGGNLVRSLFLKHELHSLFKVQLNKSV